MLLTVRRGYRPLTGPVPGVSRGLYPLHEQSGWGSGAEEVEDGEDLQSAYEHLQGAGNQQTAFPSMKKRSAQEIILKSSEFI